MVYKPKSFTEISIREKMADALRKDGEGRSVGGHGTYYQETGKRLWEPRIDSFKKSAYATKKCADIYYMEATENQVDATYVDGKVIIAHNGQERAKVGNIIRDFQKICGVKIR